jgi:hypothetical protein
MSKYSIFSILLLNSINLASSLKVREQVAHPYKITGLITVLYMLILGSWQEMLVRYYSN